MSEGGPVGQAVVARVGVVEVREALGIAVVERATVDDRATDRGAVSTDELGEAVHDDVGTVFERADQVRGGHGVVDDQRHADFVGHVTHAPDVEHVVLRVGNDLAVERLGPLVRRRPPLLEVVGVIDERDLDPHLGQGVVQQVVAAAVERRRRDHVVARLGQVHERERRGRLA